MKRWLLIILAAVLLAGGGGLLIAAANQETRQVATIRAAVFSEADFLADVTRWLGNGDGIVIVEAEGDWFRISAWIPAGQTVPQPLDGWVHAMALTDRDYEVDYTDEGIAEAGSGFSAEEQSTAARAFNKDVEASYLAQNPNLQRRIAQVEQVELQVLPAGALQAFLREGGLGKEAK